MGNSMREPFDVQGVWWLPAAPDHKVPGWFNWDPDHGGTLRLAGSLEAPQWDKHQLDGGSEERYAEWAEGGAKYPRIHGQSGRRIFNLERCFRLSFQANLCREEDAAERIHVDWLLDGVWYEDTELLEATRAVAELQFLTTWIDNNALGLDVARSDEVHASATARRWEASPVVLGDGLAGRLLQSHTVTGDRRSELTLAQRILCAVQADEPRSLELFTVRIGYLQDLLTIAAGRVANVRDIYFEHDDVPEYTLSGDSVPGSHAELRLFTRWANRDENTAEMSPEAMLFTYEDFGGARGIEQWMSMAQHYRSELRRIMAAHYSPGFLEDRVFSVVAALESFDRARLGQRGTHLIDRLTNCVVFAGTPFVEVLGGEPTDVWARRVTDHRNALGHHSDAFRQNLSLVERELADQLMWLAQLCLLRAANAPEPVFEKVAANSRFRALAGRAAAAARERSERLAAASRTSRP